MFQIKQSFSGVPNWEKHAKKILFDYTSGAETPKYGIENRQDQRPFIPEKKTLAQLSSNEMLDRNQRNTINPKIHHERVFSQSSNYDIKGISSQ